MRRTPPHRWRAALAAAALMVPAMVATAVATPAAADTGTPRTIPALRDWQSEPGQAFTWTSDSRVVVHSPDIDRLSSEADTFATDLAGLPDGGSAPPPEVVDAPARTGDVVVSLDADDTDLGQEGYLLTIGPILRIRANTPAGAFWGTRSVLQLLTQDRTVQPGTARDRPSYRTRSVLVDPGGRTFPMSWWSNLIRNMSYYKMDQLTFASNWAGLTPKQEGQVEDLAAAYHVTLLPEANSPGHMNFSNDITSVPEQYQLYDDDGNPAEPAHGSIDLTNPDAVAWAHRQIVNNVERFDHTDTWAIGGDEWPQFGLDLTDPGQAWTELVSRTHQQLGASATLADLYKRYINGVDDLLADHQLTASMWNDRIYPSDVVKLHSDITVQDWIKVPGTVDATQLAADGHQIVNADQDYLYYNGGSDDLPSTTPAKIWEQFDPGRLSGDERLPGGASDPHLAGVQFSQWDTGLSAGAVEQAITPMFEALSQQAWGSTPQESTWKAMKPTVDAIGRSPGVVATPVPPGENSLPGSPAEVFGNSQNVFTITEDGGLAHRWWQPGSTDPKTETMADAGTVAGTPVAVASATNQDVFARGSNGHLLHWSSAAVSADWQLTDWTALAGGDGDVAAGIDGDPAAVTYGTQQHVFARSADGRLHHWWRADDQVHGDGWGGTLSGRPAAVVLGYTQHVFAVDSHGVLRHWSWQPDEDVSRDTWATGLASGAAPAALAYQDDQLHVYVRDTASHLQHFRWSPATPTVDAGDYTATTGDTIAGSPTCYVYKTQQHVYFRDGDNGHLDHVWNTPGRGVGSEDVTTAYPGQAVPAGDPTGFDYLDSEQHVFAVDADSHLQHWWWVESSDSHDHDTWN